MDVANIVMDTRLGSSELDSGLLFRLQELFFHTDVLDLEAMGFVQLIDQGQFNFITLLHDQRRRKPDLGPIEEHVNQGEFFRFGYGDMAASQDEPCEEYTQSA